MATGLTDVLVALQQGVQAVNNLTSTIKGIFPQLVSNSTSAPATNGTITFNSSEALGFQLVTLSSGATIKIAYYPQ